jgi:hypothetical protein
MYLVNRTRVVRTNQAQQAMAFAPMVAAKVTSVTGVEVSSWVSVWSQSSVSIVWAAWFDNLSDWEEMNGKLATDSSFADAAAQGSEFFVDGMADGLLQVVRPPAQETDASYVSVVRAVAAPGHLADAMGHGVALAEAAEKVGGLGTMFASTVSGPYGGCAWFSASSSIAAMEAAQGKTSSDPGFVTLVDAGGAFFQTGAETTMYRRIS